MFLVRATFHERGTRMPNWIRICGTDEVEREDMLRVTHAGQVLLVIRSPEDAFFCIDGICSHEKVELANGLVMDHSIECPKHSGCFDYRNGEAIRAPACINLRTWPTRIEDGAVFIAV